MRNPNHNQLADALAAAADVAGVGRLLELLGYELTEPPSGVPLGDGVTRVACASGIDVLCLESDDELGASARAARIRGILAGGPRAVLLAWPGADALTLATGGLDGRARVTTVSRTGTRASELETVAELVVRDESALAALSRHAHALDRASLTRRFFRDFRAQRDTVSAAWLAVPVRARADRDQLALLFLSRVVFLYFLQKQGHLLGRPDYLVALVRDASLAHDARSIFARVFRPLFFGVLNRPLDDRDADARALGPLPYLNGGLFEPHALERRNPDLDLPDAVMLGVFDGLFERYRFTAADAARDGAAAPGIEPEMLGRMFEGLMAADRRGRTGTFYTPAAVVDRIVKQALQGWLGGHPGLDWRAAGMILRERAPTYASDPALLERVRDLRVIDPACGSGAFVLGALERLGRLRRSLGEPASAHDVRRDLAANALHGVDVEPDAALLCALRLWLALAPGSSAAAPVRPLPNLDHRVRQGDALLDPLDLAARGDAGAEVWRAAALDAGVRRARRLLAALVRRYGAAPASERLALRRRIGRAEVRLARRWIDGALGRLDRERRGVLARARARDLFGRSADRRGDRAELGRLRDARHELRRLSRRLRDDSALPFFSFALHFGDAGDAAVAGFDLVVSNPPWVRSHRWPRAFSALIRSRYRVCRDGGWRPAAAGSTSERADVMRRPAAGQVDLALIFVERSIDLLRSGGVIGMLLPAKAFRSISAGGARALVRERTALLAIEDHALHHRAIFRGADAFAGVVIARKPSTPEPTRSPDRVRVTMTHRASPPLRFSVGVRDLHLDRDDARSPWLLVPPDVRAALRAMQGQGVPLGKTHGIRRGAMTGANDALLFDRAERKLGDAIVAWPASGGASRSVLLHTRDVCPIVRGSGVRPFRYETEGFVAWCHDDATAAAIQPSRRLGRHLAAAQSRLRARPGWRAGLPDGALFRLDDAMLRPRVAWRDIATDLEVARLPGRVRVLGNERPLVALNTVYFIPLDDDVDASALVALLSSLPCRVFARAIAERAKDARFRFFAWTVASIPLPTVPPEARLALARLSDRAHEEAAHGSVSDALRDEIDAIVCALYRLPGRRVDALRSFDAWLAGRAAPAATATPLAVAS